MTEFERKVNDNSQIAKLLAENAKLQTECNELAESVARLRLVFQWLHNMGGLGMDKHQEICKVLNETLDPSNALSIHDAEIRQPLLEQIDALKAERAGLAVALNARGECYKCKGCGYFYETPRDPEGYLILSVGLVLRECLCGGFDPATILATHDAEVRNPLLQRIEVLETNILDWYESTADTSDSLWYVAEAIAKRQESKN
jgi:hypothetical protein